MNRAFNYFVVAIVAVVVWEYGHPYIPGLVVEHDHEHVCEVNGD